MLSNTSKIKLGTKALELAQASSLQTHNLKRVLKVKTQKSFIIQVQLIVYGNKQLL